MSDLEKKLNADENPVLSKVKVGTLTYNLKDAKARADIAQEISDREAAVTAEAELRSTADEGLSERITALESKGRYLSTWNAETGKPDTYPEVAGDYPKTYTYRAGDYYIVNKVAASGNLMPAGTAIVKDSAEAEWTVPSATFTGGTLSLGDQFQFDGTKWTYIASATTVAFANIQGDAMDNTNLAGKLNAKVNVADAGKLAYVDTASGSTSLNTIDSITVSPVTVAGNAAITTTATTATITAAAAYTPAGKVKVGTTENGAVVVNGSIDVTVKDAAAATAVTDITYSSYTPAGTISKPDVNVDDSAKDTFVKSLKAGDTAAATFTQGTKASFTQGAKANLTTSTITYVESGFTVAPDKDDAEMLVFTNVTAKSASAVDTFTANGDDTFTPNGDDTFNSEKLPVVDGTADAVTAVTAALAKEPEFTGTADNVKFAGAKYLKQEIDTKTFTPTTENLSFAGTEQKDLIPTEITYDKADPTAAYSTTVTPEIPAENITRTAKTISITVSTGS